MLFGQKSMVKLASNIEGFAQISEHHPEVAGMMTSHHDLGLLSTGKPADQEVWQAVGQVCL